jgi:ATP-dependent Clp protease ATP-binding subunit ClpC
MWQRFSKEAREAIYKAQAIAEARKDGQVSSGHILMSLCTQAGTVADHILATHQLSQQQVLAATEAALPVGGHVAFKHDMPLTAEVKAIVDLAYDEARRLKNRYIGTEHLLLACTGSKSGIAAKVLAELGVTIDSARAALLSYREAAAGNGK